MNEKYHYELQIADVNNAERPEYENKNNPIWETVLYAETAEKLLYEIETALNDEFSFDNVWCRIVKDGIVLSSGLKV
jgi:hypothetical protein